MTVTKLDYQDYPDFPPAASTVYPLDEKSRRERRELMREYALLVAEYNAATWNRSIKCAKGNHAPEGCQNDGTTCICACHDREEPSGG